jgi:hypothetical protein
VLLWLAFSVKVPEPLPAPALPHPPRIRLVDPVVASGTLLLDPAPLFLPTRYSSARIDSPPAEPGGNFAPFPMKKAFSDAELNLSLPAAAPVPRSPADALAGDPPGAPFIGFGQSNDIVQRIDRRAAYVEVLDAGTGRSVLGVALADAQPPQGVAWQPMVLMAAVDSAGLVGPLTPETRSGVEDVDTYFERYLADDFRIGQRLQPGFYRIIVGP